MAKYSIEGQTLDNIANAILAKTGSSTPLTPENMPSAIAGIETGGGVTAPYMECSINDTNNITAVSMHGYSVVPNNHFHNNDKLTEVDFSNSNITGIGNYAFYGCTSLQLDSLPDGVTFINPRAFYSCNKISLTKLPESITYVGSYAFYGCSKITLVTIPDQITSIGEFTFSNCNLIAWTRLPSSLTSIDKYGFNNCTGLLLTKIPDTIDTVSNYAFSGCTGLVNLEIGATSIEEYAFQNCTGLQKIWIRNSCATITASSSSKSPFVGCSSSLQIYVEASEAPSGWGAYFSRTGTSGNSTATVVYNQTTCPW